MTELTFELRDGHYVCHLAENHGGGVIHLLLKERGVVSVLANLPGMPESVVSTFDNPYGTSIIFELDVPDKCEVTIKSGVEVVKALWSE